MKKNRTPKSKGSTGTDNESPTSNPRPSRFIDKGVKNAIKKITLSYENKYNINTPSNIGSAYI